MPEIVVKFEDRVIEKLVTEKKRISIGRTPDNDIVLDNRAVSRKHALIEFGPQGTVIMDNESLNGTFVNNRKITEEILKDSDQITIGKFNLIFHQETPKQTKLSDLDGTMVLKTKKQKELLEKDKKEKQIVEKVGCSVLLGEDKAELKEYPLDKDVITLGKSGYNHIRVKGFFTSGLQAKLTREPQGWLLVNVGRKSKTKVNGEQVESYRLKNDDLIQVGSTVFRFVEGKK
jgi:pSer/pThr/pTyr-binding forkhead associated (FHA) protein